MKAEELVKIIDSEFYTGVPDSQLKPLCDFLMKEYGISDKHIIAANEGNCVALAAGYHLATGKVPVVYLQNSGIGNIINPVTSLIHEKVYGIPCIFIVGWRGEPEVHDEPQHIFQGEITLKLLEDVDISHFVIRKDTCEEDLQAQMKKFEQLLQRGKSVAFVVAKDALSYDEKIKYSNCNTLTREEVIKEITSVSDQDIIIATTGKAGRELFEIREMNNKSHKYDFLTIGSMGHSSSIALSVALNRPKMKVWCIDGDGAALMHLGAMPTIAAAAPENLVHIVINNGAHETVGGMPTAAGNIQFVKIAQSCGYQKTISVDNMDDLKKALIYGKSHNELCFIEVKCAIGARDNLGRPTSTAQDNKREFMTYLQ